MVATIARIFGPASLDVAEEVVQHALLQALQLWPFYGVPDNPRAWLVRVARNRGLDMLRHTGMEARYAGQLEAWAATQTQTSCEDRVLNQELADNQLRLMFVCCHPEIPHPSRVALTLKTLCGFGVTEIARAFLVSETTIAQRLVRAKRLIRERCLAFEVPGPEALPERLSSVLEVLYLFFNEGYTASQGDALIREDVCREAIRLTSLLVENRMTATPEVHALLALMLCQAARFAARLDHSGDVLLLADQDRALWDQSLIARGLYHLDRAAVGNRLSPYHLQAGIAAAHATATRFGRTDWRYVCTLYDALAKLEPTPVVLLNRAIAIAQVEGPEAGLAAIEAADLDTQLKTYPLLAATKGALYLRLGKRERALMTFKAALKQVKTTPERRFLHRKIADCREETKILKPNS